jgi:anti-sigma factor RsiW
MTITCEHVDTVLSAWLEGDLGDEERRAVDAHLRECLPCASLVRDIENIRRDAANLPEMAPSRDLWGGIAARIEAPVIELKPRQAPAPARRTWQMAAAAVVLMAVSSGVTYVLTSGQRPASRWRRPRIAFRAPLSRRRPRTLSFPGLGPRQAAAPRS